MQVLALALTLAAGLALQTASPYDKWLKEDVVYIIQNGERAAFENLKSDEDRDHFIDQFWERRNPVPGSPANQFKQEHYRRIAYANLHYSAVTLAGWKSDRGRIYIQYGPPDEIESHPSPNGAVPYEEWMYHLLKGIGRNVIVRFEDPSFTGDFRMTADPYR